MECLFKDSCNFFIVITSILDFRIINDNGLSMCVFKVFNGHNIVFFSFTFLVCFNCTVYNVYSFFVVITRYSVDFRIRTKKYTDSHFRLQSILQISKFILHIMSRNCCGCVAIIFRLRSEFYHQKMQAVLVNRD